MTTTEVRAKRVMLGGVGNGIGRRAQRKRDEERHRRIVVPDITEDRQVVGLLDRVPVQFDRPFMKVPILYSKEGGRAMRVDLMIRAKVFGGAGPIRKAPTASRKVGRGHGMTVPRTGADRGS